MRVLLTGGGTAGHVNPALAIAEIIRAREPDSVIEYVGTPEGIEAKLVGRNNIPFHPIRVQGLSRSLSPSNIRALFRALTAYHDCKRLIREFSPDVVIGTGGYVSWAPVRAAAALKVPAVLHESNAQPGFAVKTLSDRADLILVNFEGTKAFLKGKKARVERVGMPVNKAFFKGRNAASLPGISALAEKRERGWQDGYAGRENERNPDGRKKILSFGGSLGAHTLNLCAIRLAIYLKDHPDILLEHACGAREYEDIKKRFAEEGLLLPNVKLSEYIYDMPTKMAKADLVICRSGASTLAELAAAGKAAILIPSPNVTGDQQRKNAAQLAEKGAAVVLEDADACERVVEVVENLFSQSASLCPDKEKKLSMMRERIASFSIADCDERLYRAIRRLIDERAESGRKPKA